MHVIPILADAFQHKLNRCNVEGRHSSPLLVWREPRRAHLKRLVPHLEPSLSPPNFS